MASKSVANWWRRSCGPADVLALALPLVLSTASWTLMHFVDRVFLSWHSTQAIAAAMPAGAAHFAMICFPLGVAGYVNTFVAQNFGANRRHQVGRVVWQGVWLSVACLPIFLLSIPAAPTLVSWGQHPPAVQRLEVSYFQATAVGATGSVLAAALSSFFTGTGRTRVVLVVDVFVALVNLVLDYMLIFGVGGLPEWGMFGAGVATSISQWVKALSFALIMSRKCNRVEFGLLSGCCWDGPLLARLLRFGGPNGLQVFVEMLAFTIVAFQMGRLGETALAATTIAFSVNSIAFVPMLGLGIAVSTLVGQQLGGQRPDLAERATWTSLWLGGVYTGVMALLYIGAPDLFTMAFAAGDRGQFDELRDVCRTLLRFVAAYCVLDMVQIVFSSAIKGAGDTSFVLKATLVLAPFPVMLGWMGLTFWNWRLAMFWWTVTIWIWLLGAVYFSRFRSGPWRQMRVIEADGISNVPT